jgi:all-trans-8'-apo-beta-carotenal 15,15'-oxygenase
MTYREVDFDRVPAGQVFRFKVDLKAGTATSDCVIDRSCEFPTLHPNQVGRDYRYLYIGAAHHATGNAPLQALLKRDLATGAPNNSGAKPRAALWVSQFLCSRPGSTAEDDGWVLCLTYNAARQCSDLIILDAQQIATGPIARLKLRHHVPYGLHGSFVGDYFGPQ